MLIKTLFLLEAIVFLIIYIYIFRKGYRKNLPLLYLSSIMFMFMFLSPLYGHIYEVKSLFSTYLWDYYPDVIFNYSLATIFFFIGYLVIQLNKKTIKKSVISTSSNNVPISFIRIGMLIGIISFVLWGKTAGVSLQSMFLLNFFGFSNYATEATERGNMYLLLMIELFIPLIILSLFSKMTKIEIFLWTFIISIIYLSQGFRYRFILLVSSFILVYLYNNSLKFNKKIGKKVVILFIVLPIGMYSIINISNYRSDIRKSVGGQSINYAETKGEREFLNIVFASTRNYLAFAALIRYMDKNNISYGYGETMIGHVFIRLIPKFFFEDGIKPRPPANIISANSWNDSKAKYVGEAFGGVGGAYIELGLFGVILFFLLFGMIVAWLTKKLNSSRNAIVFTMYIVISVSMFKIITRGYLPEFFFTFGFQMLPFLYLKFMSPKTWKMKSNNASKGI